jgi:hypothetical protein
MHLNGSDNGVFDVKQGERSQKIHRKTTAEGLTHWFEYLNSSRVMFPLTNGKR